MLASCNLLFYHIPFHLMYFGIRNRIIRSNDWIYILNGPFVILFYMLMFDVLFYGLHRYFHVNKYLYNKIHRIHHYWTKPFAITGLACHPIEFVVIMLPYIIPVILFPYTHIYWLYLYSIGTALNNTISHSGLLLEHAIMIYIINISNIIMELLSFQNSIWIIFSIQSIKVL